MKSIEKESVIHGNAWGKIHGGYFSDPSVAAPLIKEISVVALEKTPNMILDLGGGTGFLLSRLHSILKNSNIQYYNLDCSDVQLESVQNSFIQLIKGSLDKFEIVSIAPPYEQILYVMRSVLHYFGKSNYIPILSHLRNQAKAGEYYIHQTACFENQKDADCLNRIYELMGTDKWYPAISQMNEFLKQTGWDVLSIKPAASLSLTSDELMKRYHFDAHRVALIISEILKFYQENDDVFVQNEFGFEAFLQYKIFICKAI